jgi:hypothetical protein
MLILVHRAVPYLYCGQHALLASFVSATGADCSLMPATPDIMHRAPRRFNNWAEFAIIGERLSLFYKQRDNKFYPTWAFALPNIVLLQMPQGFMESLIWSVIS